MRLEGTLCLNLGPNADGSFDKNEVNSLLDFTKIDTFKECYSIIELRENTNQVIHFFVHFYFWCVRGVTFRI